MENISNSSFEKDEYIDNKQKARTKRSKISFRFLFFLLSHNYNVLPIRKGGRQATAQKEKVFYEKVLNNNINRKDNFIKMKR